MTRMLPASTPERTPFSEQEMFDIIRTAEGMDDYYCLHSVGLASHPRKDYAEIDFVLIGPLGIYCIEAKGGTISRDNGTWIIGSKYRSYTSREGPFRQAESSRWPLISAINEALNIQLRKTSIVGWGVAFPQTVFNELSSEWDLQVVYDQRDKSQPFLSYIERLANYFRTKYVERGQVHPAPLSPTKVKEIVNFLRGDFDAVPSLKGLIAESERELILLMPDQYKILDFALHSGNPRILCDGAAGTGKTLIALEAAQRLADKGLRVLFLCFNTNLASYVRTAVRETKIPIRISTAFRFIASVIKKAGYGERLRAAHATISDKTLFTETYGDIFLEALTAPFSNETIPAFDVLVIDEAQDVLNAHLMDCLDMILKNGFGNGRWAIFLDSEVQSKVYGRMEQSVLENIRKQHPAEFYLKENFRNPRNFVKEMCIVTGLEEPICRREIHARVEYITYTDEKSQGKKLRALLVSLLRERVKPNDVSILSGREKSRSCVARFPPDIGKPVHFLDGSRSTIPRESLIASSISAFKGLESEIVILTDLPELDDQFEWGKSIYYVGMTRARTKLYALVNAAYIDARESI